LPSIRAAARFYLYWDIMDYIRAKEVKIDEPPVGGYCTEYF
jgi:hypothetical protein